MDKQEFISAIREFCMKNANQANVEKYSKYFKTEYVAYGLTHPQMHLFAKDMTKNTDLLLNTVIEAAPELIKSGMYEETTLALLTLDGLHKQFNKSTLHAVEHFFEIGIDNWAHADNMGMFVVPKFLKQEIIQHTDLKPWLQSKHKFQRRTVPVALIKLLKTTHDFTLLFKFIEPLIMDSEREVHQGVGWFLREAWKKKREETELFLLKWKDKAPRLIIQYATEKMTSEEKLRFRKNKE
jgi:3-methyladenine DNA glycosylase AlkD